MKKTDKEYRQKVLEIWEQRIAEDPTHIRKLLKYMEHLIIVRPLVIEDLERGVAPSILEDRYGLNPTSIRYIGVKAGIYSSHPNIKKRFPNCRKKKEQIQENQDS